METRSASLFSASLFSGAHSEVDYVAWNVEHPTHPELRCSSSQKDRRIVFRDARRISRALSVYLAIVM
jgi:THO complex subunit 3